MTSSALGARTSKARHVAVTLASHNRRQKTLDCLRALTGQVDPGVAVSVFLVDDGSQDGTADAIREQFPHVRLLAGSGDLYWAGGMKVAERHALLEDPDFLMWLNDDVLLEPHALAHLVGSYDDLSAGTHGAPAIIVGATRDGSGRTSYGGVRRRSRLRPMQFSLMEPSNWPQRCTTMNGNVVLVPTDVIRRLGGIDAGYRHGMADFDYGLRALRADIPVWLTSGWVGACEQNALRGSFRDPSLTAAARFRLLLSQKGIPPREWFRLTRRHAGIGWPIYFASPYVHFVIDLCRRCVGRVGSTGTLDGGRS